MTSLSRHIRSQGVKYRNQNSTCVLIPVVKEPWCPLRPGVYMRTDTSGERTMVSLTAWCEQYMRTDTSGERTMVSLTAWCDLILFRFCDILSRHVNEILSCFCKTHMDTVLDMH